jgi:ABC-type multidrug transport system, ATPase and permease components
VRIGGYDVRDVTQESLHDVVGVVTQDAHLFHDTIRANLTYARPEATELELIQACEAAQIWDLISGCPTGWTPWWGTGATGCPAARSSASPWPGCC